MTVHAMFSPEHDHVDMMASGLVEFPNGLSLIFDCGMWAYNRQLLEILGTEGRIEVPMPFNARDEDAEFFVYTGDEMRRVDATGANPYIQQVDDFAAAVFTGKRLIAPEDPVLSMRLIETCLASAKQRQRISML
ncbi:hypothetical protein D3C71_1766630 [compost metagenome]